MDDAHMPHVHAHSVHKPMQERLSILLRNIPRACCARTHPAANAASCIAHSMCNIWAEEVLAGLHQVRRESIPGGWPDSPVPSTWPHSSFDLYSWPCLWCCNHLMVDLRKCPILLPNSAQKIPGQIPPMHGVRGGLRALPAIFGIFRGEGIWKGGSKSLPRDFSIFAAGMWEQSHLPHPS